ncbi:MAG: hypothetical protein ABI846_00965 [Rudaea sp.]
MKLVIALVVGVLVGAMCAVIVANTLRQRDAYARGLMDVMQHHYAGLRESVRARRCEPTASAHALAQLRALAPDIDAAVFADDTPEASFRELSARLVTSLEHAPPADCAALAPIVQQVGKVCDECHQQYR